MSSSSSPELGVLQGQVCELQEEVKELSLSVSGLLTLEHRMKAVEAQQRAQDARLEHIDRVVMSIQSDIQKLQKTFGNLEQQKAQDSRKLDDIYTVQMRLLDLLLPRESTTQQTLIPGT